MNRRTVLLVAGAVVALTGRPQFALAQTVNPCPGNCIEVSVTPATQTVAANGTAQVGVTFKQAPDNGQAGGPDETAAVALTLRLSGDDSVPLRLSDCTLNAEGLPAAVQPQVPNFRVVVENASCADRTHCLCPDPGSGITPDNFINLVVYGPDPLPTPGPNPIDIPTLPAGPQQLVTIGLRAAGDASGTIPLRIYNQVQDASHPSFTALLSVGDKVAVDQTCVPATGQVPCSGNATSQVAISHGEIVVSGGGPVCVGDCNDDNEVTVNELILMVGISLGNQPLSACTIGDENGDGEITINEIIRAVNFALGVCPE